MRNQTSFRLTTTVLPTDKWADHKAKVTQVINKVNESGEKYYPTFTEETVVLTNDDRTIMETVRAVCNNWVMEFVKRWLNDTEDATEWQNRALTWNPWTLCFITAWASDWIDKDDDITWTGDQTYTGDLYSTGSATYRGRLITEKWVQYPDFDSLAELEAYSDPFPWMFAVLNSNGELYRYNGLSEQRDVVTTSTPAIPEQASTVAIWTVRGATDAEFTAWTGTGSQWELLVATPAQIQANLGVKFELFTLTSTSDTTTGQAVLDCWKAWKFPIVFHSSTSSQWYTDVRAFFVAQDRHWAWLRLQAIWFSYDMDEQTWVVSNIDPHMINFAYRDDYVLKAIGILD